MQLIKKKSASTGSCFHTVHQPPIKICSTARAHSPAAGHPTEQLLHALGSGRQGRNQRGNHNSIWGLAAREGIRHALGSAHNLPSRFCALPDECVTPATPMITRNYLTELGRFPITSTDSPPNIAVHQEVGVPRMGHSYC